ncbi:hypothetical protein F5X97DRAFT_327393 [Nemania serpens]|nr:hypothetical protein F5X97DRAFT_327393 [Nemania serpens]
MLAVFLRVLEYYKGVLFMAANRVGAPEEPLWSHVQSASGTCPWPSTARSMSHVTVSSGWQKIAASQWSHQSLVKGDDRRVRSMAQTSTEFEQFLKKIQRDDGADDQDEADDYHADDHKYEALDPPQLRRPTRPAGRRFFG